MDYIPPNPISSSGIDAQPVNHHLHNHFVGITSTCNLASKA